MTTKLSLQVKEAGGLAYSRCFSQGTYEVLLDDQLFAELAALWDCATLTELNARVLQSSYSRAAQAFLQAVRTQVGAQHAQARVVQPAQPEYL